MKKFALVMTLAFLTTVALVSFAQACGDSIYDIQTDPIGHPEGTLGVPCDVIVTATRYNGFYCQQVADPGINPNGEYSGIWVYTGTDEGYVPGDRLSVCGLITEFHDLTELDVPGAGLYGYTLFLESGAPLDPYIVPAADLAADGEPWESVQITIPDGMEVPAGYDLGFGEWLVTALDGTGLQFDDYWYDFAQVAEGQCYNNATGIYNFSFSNFKLEPYADGIPIVDCAVGVEDLSLSTVKAMFR